MRILTLLFIFTACIFAQNPIYVSEVYSGDSFKGVFVNKTIEVRLWGLDSPEQGQPYAEESFEHLKNMILSNIVIIYPMGKDPFGREICIATINKSNINMNLIRNGYAVYHDIGKKDIDFMWQYKELQIEAQYNKLGIWSGGTNIQTPSEFRRQVVNGKNNQKK
jgi:endonuclease YncB( thermonuclease family)